MDGSWEVVCDGTDWVECEGADGGGVGVGVDWAAWGGGALFYADYEKLEKAWIFYFFLTITATFFPIGSA